MPDGVPGVIPRTGRFPLVDAVEIAEVWQDQVVDEALQDVVIPHLGTPYPVTYSCLLCRNSWLTYGVYAHVLCRSAVRCCHFGDMCINVNLEA